MISTIGFIAGACTLLSMLPQIRRTYRTRRADDISMKMLMLLFIGASLWGVYGVLLEQLPIVLFNLIYLSLLGWQIFLKRKYSNRDKTIVVNGVEIKTDMSIATYVDISQLAGLPFREDYSLTWRFGNSIKGIMHYKSNPVILEDGMKFNIILTGNA